MARPTTIRIPEDILRQIDRQAKDLKVDRSTYLREVLTKGLSVDKQERVLRAYTRRDLTMQEACRKLGSDPWQFLDMLSAANVPLNVTLEDWIDSVDYVTMGTSVNK